MPFSDKIIWITSASSGIRKALAIELSNKNSKMILSSRNKSDLGLVKNKCKNHNDVKIITLDLEDYNNVQTNADKTITAFGKVDILVNNGGISQRAFIKDTYFC